jgi:hypothetical protein
MLKFKETRIRWGLRGRRPDHWGGSPRHAWLAGTMENPLDHRSFIWIINDADKLVFVNDAWLAFAGENTAPQLTASLVLDQPIWRFIQGQETSYLYKQIFRRVRAGKSPVKFPFRCDSPDCRRFMEMQLSLLPGNAIQFMAQILRQEWRQSLDFLDTSRDIPREFLKICSWCKKINIPGRGWEEITAAIVALDLFGRHPMPRMTHTICDACHSAIRLELNQESDEKLNSDRTRPNATAPGEGGRP